MKTNRIESVFKDLQHNQGKAFIPYIMAGDPSLKRTVEIVCLLKECGADIVELGVPFTDPLADGPTIQRAAERAFKRGITLKKVIEAVKAIREKSQIPIVLMTYFNPIYKYGLETFFDDAQRSGVDGLIIPDLPPDEAGELLKIARQYNIATIFLLAPTSTDKRIKIVSNASTGFIYYVSLTGITGSQLTIDKKMKMMIKKIKVTSKKPVAIGFGVKKPEEAKAIAEIADGVIVGSSIVKAVHEDKNNLVAYLKALRRAINGVV